TCTISQKNAECDNGHLIVTKETCPAVDPTIFSITLAGTGSLKEGSSTRSISAGQSVDYKVTPGIYSVTESAQAGWHQTDSTCNDVVVDKGQTAYCKISNSGPACNPTGFCSTDTIQSVLDTQKGRFPGNLGPDVVVDLRTQSLQAALDTATDTNGDGYIIVGVIAQDGRNPGGVGSEEIQINRAYDKPFGLLGCE